MTRVFGLVLLLAALPARAQSPFLELAPFQFGQEAWYATDPGVLGISAVGRRVVPLHLLLPDVSEDSRFELLTLKAGVRSANRDARPAFAVRAVDAFVAKHPWGGGFTLLAYDRTGPLLVEADWLAIRGGPALRFGGFDRALEVRLMAELAVSTLGITGGLFVGPSEASFGGRGTGRAEILARLSRDAVASFQTRISAFAGGEDPQVFSWNAGLTLWPQNSFSLKGSLGRLEVSQDNYLSRSELVAGVSIQITPRNRDF